jgi:hypothetical protein
MGMKKISLWNCGSRWNCGSCWNCGSRWNCGLEIQRDNHHHNVAAWLFSVEQLDYHSIQYLEQLYIGV